MPSAPAAVGDSVGAVSAWARTEESLEQDKSGQGDRTAQGGARGLLQGGKEAGGSVLPAGKVEEQVSPTWLTQVCGGELSPSTLARLCSLHFQLPSLSQDDFQLTSKLKSKV